MISFCFLGEKLNLEQLYFSVLSVEWYCPRRIVQWEQEAGSARRPATCYMRFVAVDAPPARLS